MARSGLSIEGIIPTSEELAAIERQSPHSFIDVPDGQGGKRPLAIVTRANTDASVRERHVAINIERPIPRFLARSDLLRPRNEPIAIVAGGPSVKHQLDKIRKFKWIMTAGNAHDFATNNGIVPSFAVAVDCKEDTPLYFRNPAPSCSYLLASIAPPALFDQLKDYDVQLWHFEHQVKPSHYRGEKAIGWGCMVSIACIYLAFWLGFQQHHYFGYDCCLEGDDSHAYPVLEEEDKDIFATTTSVSMGDGADKVEFETTSALIACMSNFYEVYGGEWGRLLKGYVHGGGLLWENIRRSPPEMKQWLEAV